MVVVFMDHDEVQTLKNIVVYESHDQYHVG